MIVFRVLFFALFSILFLTISFLVDIILKDSKKKRKIFIKNASIFAKICLKAFNIKINIKGDFDKSTNYVIAPNHLSYLDIIILMSYFEAVFLSTDEVKSTKVFGKIAEYGGAIFIDRTKKTDVGLKSKYIEDILKDGSNMVIFFEGTNSDGSCVLPFKSSFFEPIIKAQKPILPVCIKYLKVNDEDINSSNKDLIFYYGDMKLFNHLIGFLTKVRSLEVSIEILSPSQTQFFDRKTISKTIHKEISAKYYE